MVSEAEKQALQELQTTENGLLRRMMAQIQHLQNVPDLTPYGYRGKTIEQACYAIVVQTQKEMDKLTKDFLKKFPD